MKQGKASRNSKWFGLRLGVGVTSVVTAVVLATSGTSGAHTPAVTHTCDGGLTVTTTAYDGPSTNNQIVVTIDGVTTVLPFATALTRNFPWDSTKDHVWTVFVDANRQKGDATRFDSHFEGSDKACIEDTTTTAPTTTPSEVTTTTAPDATTTTAPDSTTTTVEDTTTTTILGSGGPEPTTTIPSATTTTVVVGVQPPVPAPSPGSSGGLAAPSADLPVTGGNPWMQSGLAAVLLVAGLALVLTSRRRRPTAPDA